MRAKVKTHHQATRQLAHGWVGILHSRLERNELYCEDHAWKTESEVAA